MKQKTIKLTRLIIQLADTPHNRKALDKLQHYTATKVAVQGPCPLFKREDVKLISIFTAKLGKAP